MRKTRCCPCSILRPQKCISENHRQVTSQEGWLLYPLLAFYLRKWYLSVPSWDAKKLLLFKALLCRQPTGLHAGSKRGRSLWQCSQIHSTSALRPHFVIQLCGCACCTDSCCRLQAQPGDEFWTRWNKSIPVCELEGGQQVLQSQSSLQVVEDR